MSSGTQQALPCWEQGAWLGSLLWPLSVVFTAIAKTRRWLYQNGWLKPHRLPVPVVIVGNITVGGTGKTPLVVYVVGLLKQAGFKPGVVSRGYGGKAAHWPQTVTANSTPIEVGDEAILLAKHCACPITVGPKRVEAAQGLLARYGCDVIVSDDGLQHYKLARDVEIAVVDGARRFGNGFCLPGGPLREPLSRLQTVDMVVVNGDTAGTDEFAMQLTAAHAINLKTNELRPLANFANQPCHAIAGIGNPGRFFAMLAKMGIPCTPHAFPDHHPYQANEICFDDTKPVLMTEKDAVKCQSFADSRHWFVPVKAELAASFAGRLLHLLQHPHDR
jgi:tetraacyldisaccharide 4'-kinase